MIRERRSTTVPAIASGISTQYRIVWAQMTRCPTLSASDWSCACCASRKKPQLRPWRANMTVGMRSRWSLT